MERLTTPYADGYCDPLEVEVLEHYEINRERHKDERDGIQKKTFTKWVNKHLAKVSISLFTFRSSSAHYLNLDTILKCVLSVHSKYLGFSSSPHIFGLIDDD
ncbi:unnamed protein product [Haemonchus placei]|uniref:Calponin-homology (CH) domain-containing protein n=1 Tax=Haemonchus placei TaxID=6290 RepID=A0A0N4WPM6_HAEPC|nr:unnamed protein product [Haemonchus placei]